MNQYILSHVKFEVGLSILVLRNKAPLYKRSKLETEITIFQIPHFTISVDFSSSIISLLLFPFLITFFLPSTLAPYHERITFYAMTLDGKRMVTLLLTILSIFILS
jgi:hypothetical protein